MLFVINVNGKKEHNVSDFVEGNPAMLSLFPAHILLLLYFIVNNLCRNRRFRTAKKSKKLTLRIMNHSQMYYNVHKMRRNRRFRTAENSKKLILHNRPINLLR